MATALYRRYRPESFAEVIGQDHVTTPLRRALRAGRVGHAYLFSGPRGCGKTTSARILARCLNCAQGPTDTPCGTCDSCRDLARGGAGSLDVVEIDAASHGGVDDARELRERASFAPVRDRFKVFIIDEAHMVTSAGFNALLKLVEEPPEHVKFVFATTEPDKVIGTIRSRTHHYPFRLIPPQVLGPYLEEVCGAEGVQVGEGVMPLVVRAGGGSARDSMSVLDQLMAGAGDDGLDFPTAIALLGFTDTALLDSAITAIAQRDAPALYAAVEHVLATGHEPRRFVEDLLERMRDLIVLSAVPDKGADLLPQVPADELESMRGQTALFSPADLSQCGDLVHETLSTMSGATSPRLHLELLAARLVLRDERAALAAADAPAPESRGTAHAAQGAPARSAAPQSAPGGTSGAREEARRIAQEKVEAARQTRGGRPAAAPEPRERQGASSAAPAPGPGQQEPASAQPAQPARQEPSTGQPGQPVRQEPAPAQPARPARQDPAWAQAEQPAARETVPPRSGRQGAGAVQWGAAQPAPGQPSASQPSASQPAAAPSASSAPADVPPQAPAAPSAASAGGGLDADQVRGHWSAILDELQQIRRPSWALIAQNGHVNAAHGSTLVIGFRTEGLVNAFHRGTAAQNLADAVRRIMHAEVTVEAMVGEDPGPGGGSGRSGGGPAGPGSAPGGPGGATGAPGGGPAGPGGAPGGPGGTSWGPGTSAGPSGTAGEQHGGQSTQPAQSAHGARPPRAEPHGAAQAGAPERTAPARWGDAVAAMPSQPSAPSSAPQASAPASGAAPSSAPPRTASASAPQDEPALSPGQRASERAMQAAARAAQSSRPGPVPDRIEDFAPEPDDPYPPDPQDDYRPSAPAPQQAGPAAPPQSGPRWSDALSGTSAAPGPTTPQGAPAPGGPGGAGAAAPDGEILEVEDEGRDSLPPEEPRTYGQNALRRAIAEGRLVRSRPARNPAAPATPAPAPSSAAPTPASSEESGRGAGAWPQTAATAMPATPISAPSPVPAPVASSSGAAAAGSSSGAASDGSASARAAASWGTAGAIAGATASIAPAQAPAQSAAPAAPRSGAALVREAAQASRSAGQKGGLRRGASAAEPEVDVDPTGGATRDDEDAVVSTRNGREVVEKLLGGKVLEIIDETQGR